MSDRRQTALLAGRSSQHRPTAERKQRESAPKVRSRVEERLALYRTIVANCTDAIAIIDADGRYLEQNAMHQALTGYSDEDLEGHTPAIHLGERTFARIAAALREHGEFRGEVVSRTKSGDYRNLDLTAFEVASEDGAPVYVGIKRDISDRKRDEEVLASRQAEIHTLNAQLRRAMTETHHRVKNNLQIIAAMVDMALLDHPGTVPSEELRRLSQHIRGLATVHDVLTRSARDEAQADFVSAQTVLESLLPLLQKMAAGRSLEYRLEDARLMVRQGTSLVLVVNELVSNALKYGRSTVAVSLTQEAGAAVLEVCDDGPGFPPDFVVPRATGTGLELVQSLVRWDLGGDLWFRQSESGGARVTVTIPLALP